MNRLILAMGLVALIGFGGMGKVQGADMIWSEILSGNVLKKPKGNNLPSLKDQNIGETLCLPSGEEAPQKIIDELCRRISQVIPSTPQVNVEASCQFALQSTFGKELWDEFGLEEYENLFMANQLRQRIQSNFIKVHEDKLCSCLQEIKQTSAEDIQNNYDIAGAPGDWSNVENLIEEDGICSQVFEMISCDRLNISCNCQNPELVTEFTGEQGVYAGRGERYWCIPMEKWSQMLMAPHNAAVACLGDSPSAGAQCQVRILGCDRACDY